MSTQGSELWRQERCGHLTASRFADAIAALKSGAPSETRIRYLQEIVAERISGRPIDRYVSAAMAYGTENEFHALSAYAKRNGVEVEHIGFIQHMDLAYVGCSPDGLIGHDGLVEVKCPFEPANHIATWMNGMPEKHKAQVQGQMWVTQRKWCDFVSFDPRNEPPYDLFIQRQYRDEPYIAILEAGIIVALEEVEQILERIQQKAGASHA